jgi:hypothetical protein
MKARLPFDPSQLSNDKAAIHLDELLQLVGGKSGLFSQAGTPKKIDNTGPLPTGFAEMAGK